MTKKTTNLNASISISTMQQLEAWMAAENRSKSNAVDTLLTKGMEQKNDK